MLLQVCMINVHHCIHINLLPSYNFFLFMQKCSLLNKFEPKDANMYSFIFLFATQVISYNRSTVGNHFVEKFLIRVNYTETKIYFKTT